MTMDLLGLFHCAKCGFETAEWYPVGEFDYECENCLTISRYTVVSIDEAYFVCPICLEVHDCSSFRLCYLDFSDPEMALMLMVI